MSLSNPLQNRNFRPAALALLAGAALTAFSAVGAAQPVQNSFACETPADAANSVREAHREYFACTQPMVDEWVQQFPEEVEQLEALYEAWENSNGADLRNKPEAARWVRQYPTDFTRNDVELTPEQVLTLGPDRSAEPAEVAGNFERFFVDRDQERLFLTTEEEGLVALSIAERYAFEVEGSVGSGGGRDFFIYDANTAFVEEPGQGANRDLVVLDISDRVDPVEVARLPGVLPEISSQHLQIHAGIMDQPPTFDQYLKIRNGEATVPECGGRPSVSSHPGVFCRPDETCFTTEFVSTAESHRCVAPEVRVRNRGRMRRQPMIDGDWIGGQAEMEDSISQRPDRPSSLGMNGMGRGGGGVASAAPRASRRVEQESAPRPQRAPMEVASSEDSAATPQGGAGGAGSLSQMMVYGSTLYILSGAAGISHGWLTTFDISDARRPEVSQVLRLDNGPEALQRHDNLLLVAGRDAITTVSLGQPNRPRVLGEYRQDCPVNYDPIVVQGAIAYRTIIVDQPRSMCSSRLEVIDLSQPHSPLVRSTTPIGRPRGLAVLGDRLYVADEPKGILVFDITDPVDPITAGVWVMAGVKDLVISGFDLYAMGPDEVRTYYTGSLYESGVDALEMVRSIRGIRTIVRDGYRSGS